MSKVVKIYNQEQDTVFYFINGTRSEAFDDRSALEELLGDDFQEYWLVFGPHTDQDDEFLSSMEAAETSDEFESLIEDHPHLIEDV